jgi:2-C-methyl-D-erythritol 2,4-cyclodiphosphate synthase
VIKIRSGVGYDIHRLVPGDGLMIGGVKVSAALRAEAHSDGDVLIHSLIDALLGSVAGPDIGELFPDTDPKLKNASGAALLAQVRDLLVARDFEIINIDCVVVTEEPRLAPFKAEIVRTVSALLGIPAQDFNLKGKTKEKLDAVGRGEAIECYSIAMVRYTGVSDSDGDSKKLAE